MWTAEQYVEMDRAACAAMREHHKDLEDPVARKRAAIVRELSRRRTEKAQKTRRALRLARRRQQDAKRRKRAAKKYMPTASTLDRILWNVCARYEVSFQALKGRSQRDIHVMARWEAFTRLSNELGMSTGRIGQLFDRDHTTVIHGLRRYAELKREEGAENEVG